MLLDGYGFACGCPACDLSLSSARDGETKRIKFREELADAVDTSTESELVMTMGYLMLLKEGGITGGREISNL